MKWFVSLAFLLSVLIPFSLGAQFIPENPELLLELSPQFPGANEIVTIRIRSFDIDTDRATISWYSDGTLIAQGAGLDSITTGTGLDGRSKTIRAVATLGETTAEGSVTISGNSVDLLWEADGYTPPFYKGKTQLTPQERARVIALPSIYKNGTAIPISSLYFTWTFNGKVMQDRSGYGQSIFYNDLSSRTNSITVQVSDSNGKTLAVSSITLPRKNPEVLLYREHPIYGTLYTAALPQVIELNETELLLRAEPYGFSVFSLLDSEIVFSWLVNNQVAESIEKNLLGITGQDGGSGEVRVDVSHTRARSQKAQIQSRISF